VVTSRQVSIYARERAAYGVGGPRSWFGPGEQEEKSPEEDSGLLRNDPLLVTLPTFRKGMLPPSSGPCNFRTL
jgi:hypothetical protein